MRWQTVCSVTDLAKNSGVCALVNGVQVAIFYLPQLPLSVYAVSNYDPIGKAFVLSSGIVSNVQGQTVVVSPLYQQHFNLETGVCLEDKSVRIPIYACCIDGDRVQVDTRVIAPLKQLVFDTVALCDAA